MSSDSKPINDGPAESIHCAFQDLWKGVFSEPREQRSRKPRSEGLTVTVDGGMSGYQLHDWMTTCSPYVDGIKIEAGAVLMGENRSVARKIWMIVDGGFDLWLDAALVLAAHRQDHVEALIRRAKRIGFRHIEIPPVLPGGDTEERVASFNIARDYEVSIASTLSLLRGNRFVSPIRAARQVVLDLENGAETVRVAVPDPTPRNLTRCIEFLARFATQLPDLGRILWIAPRAVQQKLIVTLFGPNANLTEVAPADVLRLEATRRGYLVE
jgi:phosphosulfolactate synthase